MRCRFCISCSTHSWREISAARPSRTCSNNEKALSSRASRAVFSFSSCHYSYACSELPASLYAVLTSSTLWYFKTNLLGILMLTGADTDNVHANLLTVLSSFVHPFQILYQSPSTFIVGDFSSANLGLRAFMRFQQQQDGIVLSRAIVSCVSCRLLFLLCVLLCGSHIFIFSVS